MIKRSFLIFFFAAIWIACNGNPDLGRNPQSSTIDSGWSTYTRIRNTLEGSGKAIDYDTLLLTYHEMIQTRHHIPHMDQLLFSLINKRNSNPRVDQMILIHAAHVLGQSKYPVPDAQGIFKAILAQEDRLSAWVLSFVAEAIGDYCVAMPEGDKLADRLEAKLAITASSSDHDQEDFGHHFLPPPRGRYILSYLSSITSMAKRESERRHYYLLLTNGHTEADIEKALRRIQSKGMPAKKGRPYALLKHLARNPNQLAQ